MSEGIIDRIRKSVEEAKKKDNANAESKDYHYDEETGLLKLHDFKDYRKLAWLRMYFVKDMKAHDSIAIALHHASLVSAYKELSEKYGEKIIKDDLIYVGLNLDKVREILIREYNELVIKYKYSRFYSQKEAIEEVE